MQENPVYDRVIHAVLERQAEKYGDDTFFFFGERSFSYRDFLDMSRQVACGLQDMGVVKGDKIALFLPNCPEYPKDR